MLLTLLRYQPDGDAIFGLLQAVSTPEAFEAMDTLEHMQYAIPAGFYRLRVTHSPRFQELLPILDGVYGYARDPHSGVLRTGIRIHAGNTIEDTTGCILVGEMSPPPPDMKNKRRKAKSESQKACRLLSSRKHLNELVSYLLDYQKMNPKEEIFLEIRELDPYPEADEPCPLDEQQHVIDAREAEERYLQLHPEEREDYVEQLSLIERIKRLLAKPLGWVLGERR